MVYDLSILLAAERFLQGPPRVQHFSVFGT